MHAIKTEQLSKSFKLYQKEPGLSGAIKSLYARKYQEKHALKKFSISVEKGELVGLLGPNGAGKTTLMKILTGLMHPTEGEASVLGSKPHERSLGFRHKIALVMGQKSQLWWDLPAFDSFKLLQRYYEIEEKQFKHRLHDLAERLAVSEFLKIHVRRLSLGERMKLELMASLLHSPEVIFLDEPTIGLDVLAQHKIRDFLLEYHQNSNSTIILTSHYMADVEALCERIVLLLDGEMRFDDSYSKFENILGSSKVVNFSFSESLGDSDPSLEDLDITWSEDRRNIQIRIPEKEIANVTTRILEAFPVIDFKTENLPVEQVMSTIINNPEILKG